MGTATIVSCIAFICNREYSLGSVLYTHTLQELTTVQVSHIALTYLTKWHFNVPCATNQASDVSTSLDPEAPVTHHIDGCASSCGWP